MRDKYDQRLDDLFAAVRSEPVNFSGRETGFETRFMACMQERRAQTPAWQFIVWRLMPAFAVIAITVFVCSLFQPSANSGDLFASIAGDHDDHTLARSYLSGE